ncbi:hypothetical protein DH09_08415 [Bacillaceae bacterium JMAK1]|nr:hypothetical protein DH09_08415 [Bacillaceae bacterium JMAK1]
MDKLKRLEQLGNDLEKSHKELKELGRFSAHYNTWSKQLEIIADPETFFTLFDSYEIEHLNVLGTELKYRFNVCYNGIYLYTVISEAEYLKYVVKGDVVGL